MFALRNCGILEKILALFFFFKIWFSEVKNKHRLILIICRSLCGQGIRPRVNTESWIPEIPDVKWCLHHHPARLWWLMMVFGSLFLESGTDLYMLARSTLTAVMCGDAILTSITWDDSVTPGLLLVQDNVQPHVCNSWMTVTDGTD